MNKENIILFFLNLIGIIAIIFFLIQLNFFADNYWSLIIFLIIAIILLTLSISLQTKYFRFIMFNRQEYKLNEPNRTSKNKKQFYIYYDLNNNKIGKQQCLNCFRFFEGYEQYCSYCGQKCAL